MMKGSFEKSARWRKRERSWNQKIEKAKPGLASYITPYVLTHDVNTGDPKTFCFIESAKWRFYVRG